MYYSHEEDCSNLQLRYSYHPDYLGNVDMVTDRNGEAYQFFLYTPWGENMYSYRSTGTGFSSPYRFNGKELDPETGNYYYGARYYDPKISVWLSVDPLAHLSQDKTPYHFVSNNPAMRIDPNGLTDFKNEVTGEIRTVEDGMNQTVTVSEADWGAVGYFAKHEDGNSPSEDYNAFIGGNGGTAVPTEEEGGWIHDKEMFIGFMQFKAQDGRKEVAAWEVEKIDWTEPEFFVQPWKDNQRTENTTTGAPPGISKDEIKRLWHTHPFIKGYLTYGLSATDWHAAKNLRMPNRVIYPNGEMWEVEKPKPWAIIPRSIYKNGSYGHKVINP